MASPKEKKTWKLDESPPSQPLPEHVICRIKRDANASVHRFKALVLVGGNHQIYEKDYMERYATQVPFRLVRLFLCIISCMQMYLRQVTEKRAFLHRELERDVWVMSPLGIYVLRQRYLTLEKKETKIQRREPGNVK